METSSPPKKTPIYKYILLFSQLDDIKKFEKICFGFFWYVKLQKNASEGGNCSHSYHLQIFSLPQYHPHLLGSRNFDNKISYVIEDLSLNLLTMSLTYCYIVWS